MSNRSTLKTPYENEIWESDDGLRVEILRVTPDTVTVRVVYIHDYSERPGDELTFQLDEFTSDSWECLV